MARSFREYIPDNTFRSRPSRRVSATRRFFFARKAKFALTHLTACVMHIFAASRLLASDTLARWPKPYQLEARFRCQNKIA